MSKVGPLNRQQTAKAKVTFFFEFQKNENNVRACSRLFKICLVSSDLEKHRQFDTRIVEITKVTFFVSQGHFVFDSEICCILFIFIFVP